MQEQVVNPGTIQNVGEQNHICDGGPYYDYSGTVYNGGLRFQALDEFNLTLLKFILEQLVKELFN